MLSVFSDKNSWQKIISKFSDYDYYHTYDYHLISKQKDELPILLLFEDGDTVIALTFLKRSIPGTNYYDLTSVYGYSGPLSQNLTANFDLSRFKAGLIDFLMESHVVSVFMRLNPFIPDQIRILNGMGIVDKIGTLVNIDLSSDLEDQRRSFSKTTKRYLNKVRRHCYVEKGSSKADILSFMDLYNDTMRRVKAKDSYFFEESYFFKLMESKEFQTDLLLARLKDTKEIISGALMMKTKNIVQYHLSGTKEKYLNLTPLRLLIDQTRIETTSEGYKFFNLGGGLGSREDSLFYFKSSFSKDLKVWHAWKWIVLEEKYHELCKYAIEKSENHAGFKEITYFPLYRYEGN